jgi:type VI secretion system protein
MRYANPAAHLLAALLAAGVLAACGTLASLAGGPRPQAPRWQTLALAAADNANGNSALAVDVVLVKDKGVLDTLAAMPAARYFATRADLQRTFPEALTVLAVEITPGQVIQLEPKRFGAERAWAALAFANYAAPGEHRARLLLERGGYVLQLNAQGFVASDIRPGAAH